MDALYTFDIQSSVIESTVDLFDTMLSLKAEFSDADSKPAFSSTRITISLSYAGELSGSFNVHVSHDFALIMTASMLGMEPEEIESEEELNDVLLEICNIIGGSLKSKFNDAGMPCVISTPSITTGNDYDIDSMNMHRHELFKFTCQGNDIFIELFLKAEEVTDSEALSKLTSVDVKKFSRLDIISSTGDTVLELFDTMLSMELKMTEPDTQPSTKIFKHVGSVDFAGDVTGSVSIQLNDNFAHLVTSSILGIKIDEIESDDQVKDVIGEMANIVGGNLKTAFCDTGLECAMSTPAITGGKDFKISTLNMDRYEQFAFQHYEHDILVEVCVKIDASVQKATEAKGAGDDADLDKTLETIDQSGEITEKEDVEEDGAKVDYTKETIDEYAQAVKTDEAKDQEIQDKNLAVILDIPLELTVELGQTSMKIKDLLKLSPGDAVTLSNLEDEPLDILANNQLIAKGKVIVENEKYGIRITKMVNKMERIKSLKR